jgi:hypothetical protein
MRSFWSEPFLWIHLAGLAAFPLFLELCWIGLGVGDPLLPVWLEVALIASVGIIPVLWMQFSRPFNIFSILAVAIKPEKLSLDQRRILSLLKSPVHQLIASGGAVFMFWVLWQIYQAAPIATGIAPFPSSWRLAGLLLAGFAFLASNLFLQVPLAVFQVLFTSEAQFAATAAYPVEKIAQDFTIPGWQVDKILPLEITNPETLT